MRSRPSGDCPHLFLPRAQGISSRDPVGVQFLLSESPEPTGKERGVNLNPKPREAKSLVTNSQSSLCPTLTPGCGRELLGHPSEQRVGFWCLFLILLNLFTENIALGHLAWRWVSFTTPCFVEPQTLFLVPRRAVKSNPQAAETHGPAHPASDTAASTSPPDSCSGFQLLLCFYPWGVPFLSWRLSHAFRRMFVIF